MATFQFFDHFIENLAKGAFDFTDDSSSTLTVALVAAANAPNLTTGEDLADLTEISYTNCSSRVVTGASAVQTAGVLELTADDLTLSASGGDVADFRYVVLYDDDSTTDLLIGMLDYGSDFSLLNGNDFEIRFSNDGGKFGTVSIV